MLLLWCRCLPNYQKKQKKFDELTGNSLNQGREGESEKKSKKKGFMDKLKETFED